MEKKKPTIKTLLEFEEGRRRSAYKCTNGFWTIGVGHRLTDKELGMYEERISNSEVDNLLETDITEATEAAKKYPWFDKLNEARQAVVISMIFQLGTFGFAKFQNTIKLIAKGNYEAAAAQMLRSLWAKQTPNRAKRHAEQFKTGVWCEEYKKLAA